MNGQRVSFLVLLSVALFRTSVAQDVPYAKELWRADFDDDVRWVKLTDVGYLVVGTDLGLFGLNPATGAIAWKLEQFRKIPEESFEDVPGTQLAMVAKPMGTFGTQRETALVDVIEGNQLWTTKDAGLLATYGQFLLAPAGGILLYGKSGQPAKPTLILADLISGVPRWKRDSLFVVSKTPQMYSMNPAKKDSRSSLRGNQFPVWLEDGTFLELWSQNGLRKISAATGEVVWVAPIQFKRVPGIAVGYPPMLPRPGGASIFVPCGNTVHLVNTADGQPLWANPPKLPGGVNQMAETSQGLVVCGKTTKSVITLINPSSGGIVWQKKFPAKQYATAFAIRDNKLLHSIDGKVFSTNIADGATTELATGITFKGPEVPHTIELRDSGCLLISNQNMTLIDWSGKPVYHAYHKAPGASVLTQIVTTVAAAAASAGQEYVAYSTARAEGRPYPTAYDEANRKYIDNPNWTRRFNASMQAPGCVYMLTNIEGGSSGSRKNAGIIKVDKSTGRDVCRVALGTKKPEYTVDDIDNRLYFVEDSKRIVCYDF